ncbi:site-specific DNA-methyltransferase [Tuwongella immobilis]|uniref:site-specific DNA-methyltransferase (adenine-specific) n=1 Tax=Tuwongella immobilis TaxID=692036 RepID=A0A6C2YQ40_9BACT|nr:site-specific DNA-methyltransferase [Tuwongella immobilis]VIP03750.1 dna methylase n-4 : DNA methylase N-4 OS=Desulfobulbus sp. Tol-SR GN=JT06_05080 PE=4 SV=1: N6_N4_Mtase [Tuwongella immobilis]VTS04868.1 dna methylase n-4 : DNA methylase N-4 OS=Desulfobulbus sp. Tol-SR GN=JT06_05080 PE=4 SV=1: N6_N4_Mtase [Tuwongella immobilis]
MTPRKQKLELTWIGKEHRPKLEPRILLEDPARSHVAAEQVSANDLFDNRLIFGDNLLALKALEAEFTGQVKCIYIDPPYNTGSAFEHYDDGIEHSLWLSLMRDRLELLRRLLREDGSIWISIDDNELYYMKIMLDEVFGRENFVATVIWQKVYTSKNTARHFSAMHDYLVVIAKSKEIWSLNELPRQEKQNDAYRNPDNDSRGPWKATPLHARNYYSQGSYTVVSPTGQEFKPPPGRYWVMSKDSFTELDRDQRIWWGRDNSGTPNRKTFLSEVKQGVTPSTIWFHDEVGHNAEAKNEINALAFEGDVFVTPKPERLIQRVLQLATNPGDLVLDSFAGSGTTGAVAHKMGRRWIMVELGEHCHTHIIPRLKKVIDGQDPGGITEATGWKGGGGFRYFKLAPSLLMQDRWGQWVISKEYNPAMLAEALCKLEGFRYEPSDSIFWMQGRSTETDYLYCTTQTLSVEQLQQLNDEVGDGRTLLVLCCAFRGKADRWPNLTVKKIPKAVLHKCEWGHDDYSLKVENLPRAAKKKRVSLFEEED